MASRDTATRPCPHCDLAVPRSKSLCPGCRRLLDQSPEPSYLLQLVPTLEELAARGARVEPTRIRSGPWDPCFGGGIVDTSVILLAAEAGAGKTTLTLQIANAIAEQLDRDVLFIAVEMCGEEVAAYFTRLGLTQHKHLRVLSLLEDVEHLAKIDSFIALLKPALVVLDSVSKLSNGDHAGEVAMCTRAKKLASKYHSPWIIISHINKEGAIAGKQAMQHDVDCLTTFHVDVDGGRILETQTKNRFGTTPAYVSFTMTDRGLLARPTRTVPPPKDDESSDTDEESDEAESDDANDADAESTNDDDGSNEDVVASDAEIPDPDDDPPPASTRRLRRPEGSDE